MGRVLWVVLGVAFVLLLASFFLFVQRYEIVKATMNDDGVLCESVEKRCTCIGLLGVAKSYPPQYHCMGFNACSEVFDSGCTTTIGRNSSDERTVS